MFLLFFIVVDAVVCERNRSKDYNTSFYSFKDCSQLFLRRTPLGPALSVRLRVMSFLMRVT